MKQKEFVFLIGLVLVAVIIFLATSTGLKSKNDNDPFQPKPAPKTTYQCPTKNRLDCMPILQPGTEAYKLCNDREFLNWAQNNCPGFEVTY